MSDNSILGPLGITPHGIDDILTDEGQQQLLNSGKWYFDLYKYHILRKDYISMMQICIYNIYIYIIYLIR